MVVWQTDISDNERQFDNFQTPLFVLKLIETSLRPTKENCQRNYSGSYHETRIAGTSLKAYFQLHRQNYGTYRQFTVVDTKPRFYIFLNFNFPGENKITFTMDTTSLLTVIPNKEGL